MNAAAIKTSLGLSLLFLAAYGGTNLLTAHRADVGVWAYGWERHIPFVPLMIVPYMSIDLFFVASPFLCRNETELRILRRRITAAILIAGAFFISMPLRFSFERPVADGWLGAVFNSFREVDQPYNQFPSLHIALWAILATVYAGRTRGVIRIAVNVWFGLIGASTLLTCQHHVIDVVGGLALAALCFYVFGESPWRLPVTKNPRVAQIYLAGSLALLAIAIETRPVGTLLFWPTISVAIVASAYFGVGPGVYRKHDGKIALASRLLLGPALLGQWMSLRYYARRSAPWNQIAPDVWIGRVLSEPEARKAIANGVSAVIDLTCEFSMPRPFRPLPNTVIQVLDLTAPTVGQLAAAVGFLESQIGADRTVLVYCKAGYSRSAAVVAAYLLRAGIVSSVAEAVAIVRSRRPGIIVRPESLAAIESFATLSGGAGREALPAHPPPILRPVNAVSNSSTA